MAFTTFTGPILSGTVRQGPIGTTNVGVVQLAQVATVGFAAMTTTPSAQTLCTIPAGAKIMRFNVEVVTAISGGSATNVGVTFGIGGGSASQYVTTFNTGLTSAKVAQATVDAAMVVANTNNIGTADVVITGTFTSAGGNPTAGSIVVTIEYLQRSASGSTLPFSSN